MGEAGALTPCGEPGVGCGASVTIIGDQSGYRLQVLSTVADRGAVDYAATLVEAWYAAEALLHTHRLRHCERQAR